MNIKEIKKYVGRLALCEFFDHAHGADPIKCKVCGFMAYANKEHIKIVSWDVPDLDDASRMHNIEYFSIMLSTIVSLKILNIGREIKK